MVKWQGIVVHHSASPRGFWRGEKWVPVDAAMIRDWHVNERGWSDIGYHYIVLPNGKVEEGRPLDRIGAHARAGNRNFTAVGICLVGNFEYDNVGPEQLKGLVNLIRKLQGSCNIPSHKIEIHREIPGSSTQCPGRFFPRELLLKYLNSG